LKSDDKYIESIRNAYDGRNKRAIYCVVLAVIVAIIGFAVYYNMKNSLTSLQETQSRMFKEGIKITEMDLKLIKVNSEVAFSIGVQVGMLVKSFAIIFGGLVGYAIYLVVGSRKNRLLIKFYDDSKISD